MRDRDRHCPKCQGHKREAWIAARQNELLPCTYFHVVFTLPMELNPLALYRPGLVYKSLFEAAWQTLHQFGSREGLQLGMISILHTWGQNLSLHPHLHCVVPGGGVDAQHRWQHKKRYKNFLFPVKALSKVFRAKYIQCLRTGGVADQGLFDQLFSKQWVVYARRPFGGPAQVIEYLGRYTHNLSRTSGRSPSATTAYSR